MGDVPLVGIAPAFRFELLQALRLLISDQSDSMQIVRGNQREFVDRWYGSFGDMRSAIDRAMKPGSYMLCRALLTADDTLEGMQQCFRDLLTRLSSGPTWAVDIAPSETELWRAALTALASVLPEFHSRCFRQEWERWKTVLDESATRMREAVEGLDVFSFVEQFTGRDYGRFEATVHPSEFVRPSRFGRNPRPLSVGIGDRFGPEYAA